MSTLSFQPEADRYYAEGHWRAGDLWEDFAARAARGARTRSRCVLDDRARHLRRAAPRGLALSARLAAGSACSRATW